MKWYVYQSQVAQDVPGEQPGDPARHVNPGDEFRLREQLPYHWANANVATFLRTEEDAPTSKKR